MFHRKKKHLNWKCIGFSQPEKRGKGIPRQRTVKKTTSENPQKVIKIGHEAEVEAETGQ